MRRWVKVLGFGLVALVVAAVGVLDVGVPVAHADGAIAWTPAPSVDPVDSNSVDLTSISCVSTAFCQAVGGYTDSNGNMRIIAETYNGSGWSVAAVPEPANFTSGQLSGVSCVSKTFCQAVGYFSDVNGDTNSFVETYNGATWSLTTPSLPAGAQSGGLSSVFCAAVNSCHAVGSYSDGVYGHAYIQSYDGNAWSPVFTTDPADAYDVGYLSDITCASASSCVAVGSYKDTLGIAHGLIQTYDGSSWTLASIPDPVDLNNGGAELSDISCASATFCQAVGYYSTSNGYRPLVETYDGSSWSAAATPPTGPTNASTAFNGVACPTATFCVAAGYLYDGNDHALTETYNGSGWSVVPDVEPADSIGARYYGVACATATACHAIGYYVGGQVVVGRPLINTYDGTNWTFATGADPSDLGYNAAVTDISCTSATNCHAIGYYDDVDSVTHALLEDFTDGSVDPENTDSESPPNQNSNSDPDTASQSQPAKVGRKSGLSHVSTASTGTYATGSADTADATDAGTSGQDVVNSDTSGVPDEIQDAIQDMSAAGEIAAAKAGFNWWIIILVICAIIVAVIYLKASVRQGRRK